MKKSKLYLLSIVLLASFALLTACKKDGGKTDDRILEIAGFWTATSASFNGVDVVDEGGSVTLDIKENGRFTFTINRPGNDPMVFTGSFGFDEDWLEVEYDNWPGEYEYYDISWDDHNLNIGANSEFDFDGDGTDEFVVFFLDMVR